MRTHGKWILIVVWAASLAAFPQTSTRITLNVVAFDSHDQTVDDLTSKDFQVSDQGKPQRIVSFHRNADPQAALDTVTNAPKVTPPVVILFDLQDDDLRDRGQGKDEIIHALEHLESSDSLYLYLVTSQGGLEPVRGLPNPQEDNSPAEKTWTEHIKPLLEIALGKAYGLRVLNGGTLAAFESLDTALKPFPGRKNLIWMTHGLVGYGVAGGGVLNRVPTALDRDGITLSTVYQGNVAGPDINVPDYFAQLTGGTVYANDIEKAVKEALSASRSGYVIEYDAPRPDGKYHKIRITCSRKGVRLQAKQGYEAN